MIISVNEFNLSEELFNDKNKIRNFIGFCPDIKIIEENFETFENYKNEEISNAVVHRTVPVGDAPARAGRKQRHPNEFAAGS